MKTLNDELTIVGLVFSIICLTVMFFELRVANVELVKQKEYAMSVAIEEYEKKERFSVMVSSLNVYLDDIELDNENIKLLKDLR